MVRVSQSSSSLEAQDRARAREPGNTDTGASTQDASRVHGAHDPRRIHCTHTHTPALVGCRACSCMPPMRPFSLLIGKGEHSPAHDTWAHRSPPGAHASHLSNMGDPRSLEGRRNLGTPGPLSAPRAVDRAAKHSKQGLRLTPIAPWIPGSQLSPVSAAFPRRDSVGSGGHVGPVRRTSSGL